MGALMKLGGLDTAIQWAFVTKLFRPMIAFFGKGGFLVKVFGRFEKQLGVLITGFLLLTYYADDIALGIVMLLDKIKRNIFLN